MRQITTYTLFIILGLFVGLNANAEDMTLAEIESILDTNSEQVIVHPEPAPKKFKDSDIKRVLKDGSVQKFDGDKYKIVRRVHRHTKKTQTRQVVIKEPRYFKNEVSLLAGFGALGNLVEQTDTFRTVSTEQGLVLGLQYQRSIKQREDYEITLGIQAQTNKTFSGMVGIGF